MGKSAEFREITPHVAEQLLSVNADEQRNVNKRRVDQYATDMAKGLWKANGEPIIIDERGRLIDGQHRLRAVVASGVTIEALVVSGVSKDSYKTLDQGMNRGLSCAVDWVSGSGVSAGRAAAAYEISGSLKKAMNSSMACTSQEALVWMEGHKEDVLWLWDASKSLRSVVKRISDISIGSALWALTLKGYDTRGFVRELGKAYSPDAGGVANMFARSMVSIGYGAGAQNRVRTTQLLLFLGEKYAHGAEPRRDMSGSIELDDYDLI